MLVLTRKIGERVCIGSNITIVVLKSRGNRVQLGFSCPNHIPILREELQSSLPPVALIEPTLESETVPQY